MLHEIELVWIPITILKLRYRICCWLRRKICFSVNTVVRFSTSLCITHMMNPILNNCLIWYLNWKIFFHWEFCYPHKTFHSVQFPKSNLKRESFLLVLKQIFEENRITTKDIFGCRNNGKWKMISQLIHNSYTFLIFSRNMLLINGVYLFWIY